MGKKSTYILIIFIISFSLFFVSPSVRADYSVDYVYVEKNHYFIDENMYFNFSAFNDYEPNPPLVDSYFQVHIDYIKGGEPHIATPIWASPEYRDVGPIKHGFTLSLDNLNLTINQDENQTTIYIKLRYYNFDYFQPENNMDVYLSSYTKQVNVSKRGINCFTLNALQLDRDKYYLTNSMIINTSFAFNYSVKPGVNHVKIQYRILNNSDVIIWNSTWYSESKDQLYFHVNLSDLNLKISNPHHFLKIFINYSFYVNDTGTIYMEQYTIPFNITTNPMDNIKTSLLFVESTYYYYGEQAHFGFSYEMYYNCNIHYFFSLNIEHAGKTLWNSSSNSDTQKNLQFSIYLHDILPRMTKDSEVLNISLFFIFNYSETICLVNMTFFTVFNSNISFILQYDSTMEYFQNQILNVTLSNLYNSSLPLNGTCTLEVQNAKNVKEIVNNQVNFTIFYDNLSLGENVIYFKIDCENHVLMIINRTITLIKLAASNLSIKINHDPTMEIFQSQDILMNLKNEKEPSRIINGNVSLSIANGNISKNSKILEPIIANQVHFLISHKNLSIGINTLIFNIKCEGFEEKYLEKTIELSKLNVTMTYNLTITENWLKGIALFKYKQKEIPYELKNEKICMILIGNNSVINHSTYITNKSGMISFSHEIPSENITLIIDYKGNSYLKGIHEEIIIDNRKEDFYLAQYPIIGFIPIIAIIGMTMGYVMYKNKDKGETDLEKYSFRR
ncbi:MAG: hypothetical protein ACTSWE_00285 [Promethearchaeota archaeon]